MKRVGYIIFVIVVGIGGYLFGKQHTMNNLEDSTEICRMVQKMSQKVLLEISDLKKSDPEMAKSLKLAQIEITANSTLQSAKGYLLISALSGKDYRENINLLSPKKPTDFHFLLSDIPHVETGLWSNLSICDNHSFFCISLPDGTPAYTRCGSFVICDTGEMLTENGYSLNPPITGMPVGAQDPTVTEGGLVQYTNPDSGHIVDVGQIYLYTFSSPSKLKAYSRTLMLETPESGSATLGEPDCDGFGAIQCGTIESFGLNFIVELSMLLQYKHALKTLHNEKTGFCGRIWDYIQNYL